MENWTKQPQGFQFNDTDNNIYLVTVSEQGVVTVTFNGEPRGSITLFNSEFTGPAFVKQAFQEIGALLQP